MMKDALLQPRSSLMMLALLAMFAGSSGSAPVLAEEDSPLDLLRRADGLRENCGTGISWDEARDLYQRAAKKSEVAQLQVALNMARGEGGFDLDVEGAQAKARAVLAAVQSQAETGEPLAQRTLGIAYTLGIGVSADRSAATRWLENPSRSGDVEASVWLSWLQLSSGAPPDGPRKSLEQAAQQGSCTAMSELGYRFLEGRSFARDPVLAKHYLEMAANAGYPRAAQRLGIALIEGEFLPQDIERGVAALEIGAAAGHQDSMVRLGWEFSLGPNLEHDGVTAVDWFSKAAEKGNALAYNNLGWMFHNGLSVSRDFAKAATYYFEAARLGETRAFNNLANLVADPGVSAELRDQISAEIDRLQRQKNGDEARLAAKLLWAGAQGRREYEQALGWARGAAANDDLLALMMLGEAYSEGKGVDRSPERAIEYFSRAANAGDLTAAYWLGRESLAMGALGNRIPKYRNPEQARRWLTHAAEQGHWGAADLLGWALDGGYYGLERDASAALSMYRIVAANGSVAAKGKVRFLESHKP